MTVSRTCKELMFQNRTLASYLYEAGFISAKTCLLIHVRIEARTSISQQMEIKDLLSVMEKISLG
jgi:hypothetical protein